MRKQQEYSATVVRNRNELIDATTAKTKVILIEGEVLDTLHKEIKKEKRTNGGASAFSKLSAVGAVTYLIPGLNMVSIPTAAFLGIASFVFGALGADTEHLPSTTMSPGRPRRRPSSASRMPIVTVICTPLWSTPARSSMSTKNF